MSKITGSIHPIIGKKCLTCAYWQGDRERGKGNLVSCDSKTIGRCIYHENEHVYSDSCNDFITMTTDEYYVQKKIRTKQQCNKNNNKNNKSGNSHVSVVNKVKDSLAGLIGLVILCLLLGGNSFSHIFLGAEREVYTLSEAYTDDDPDKMKSLVGEWEQYFTANNIKYNKKSKKYMLKHADLFPITKDSVDKLKKSVKADVSLDEFASNPKQYKNKMICINDARISSVKEVTFDGGSAITEITFLFSDDFNTQTFKMYLYGDTKYRESDTVNVYVYLVDYVETYVDESVPVEPKFREYEGYMVGSYIE